MRAKDFTTSLIQTKLNRPPLPVVMVKRPRLTKWLDRRLGRPLTLVSAPAGYGKSTLISCWLESADCPAAWLSLDERDNDLEIFLEYFLAAIQTIFPAAAPETQALLRAIPLPPIPAIAKILVNELNQIKEPFILVLDDYYLIETQIIHNLLAGELIFNNVGTSVSTAGEGAGDGKGDDDSGSAGDAGNKKVTVCHKPDSKNPVTIEISRNTLQAHLNHGDREGACP